MIDTAVIGLFLHGRLPWPALVLILARDAVLIGGYKLIVPRGYELSVSFAGKVATWILYASLALMLATPEGTISRTCALLDRPRTLTRSRRRRLRRRALRSRT